MEITIIVLITAIAIYALFKLVTSTLDLIFKVVIALMILSFLGYSFISFDSIEEKISHSNLTEEGPLNQTTVEPINQTITDLTNETESYEESKEKNETEAQ